MSALITLLRAQDIEPTVLAIDPSSPFSGGAILGDRVRMQDHATDPGVFIRSMASRGHLGGLALAAPEAIRLLDAVGKHWILVETVGVGQVEVEIAGKADTTVVVVNPGWGDSVQANKAGLMEIADVFVINKADRAGVEDTRRDLNQMLDLSALPPDAGGRPSCPQWRRSRRAPTRCGRQCSPTENTPRRRANWRADGRNAPARSSARSSPDVSRRSHAAVSTNARWEALTEAVVAGEIDPWSAADEMLEPVIDR
ncbi:MAG: methylmalonyl Co-A mutase-associated GTPase MeaB [Ilumatobacteraceae bacterium]